MPEPDAKRPGERGDDDFGTPGLNGQDPGRKEPGAESAGSPSPEEIAGSGAAPAAGRDADEGGNEEPAEAAIDAGLSEFADDVVSGLEHARFGAEGSETFDQGSEDSGKEPAESSETLFADWGSSGTGEQGASPAQRGESFIRPDSPAPSLNALSRMGLAGNAESAGTSAQRAGKHEELADAVQSALLSIYGETAQQSAERDYPNAATGDGVSSSMSWNKGLNADFAPSNANGDSMSPQDVILNYFDYSPGGNRSAPSAYGRAPQGAPQQRNWAAQDYSAYRPERVQGEAQTAYSYPVPAAMPATSRPGGRTGQESSKLLGAAAIGLMGGIAIAASLAAFLIYGPSQSSIKIPGIGELRVDKVDLPAGQTEAGGTVKSAPEFSSEMLAADMTATPGQPAPLSLSIRPQPSERVYVSIGGLPEGGRLNAGVDMGGGNWLLTPRRLSGLTINLPAGSADAVPIQVQLLDGNARTPLSAKTGFVIRVRSTSSAGTAAPATAAFDTQTFSQPRGPVTPPAVQELSANSGAGPQIASAGTAVPATAAFNTQTFSQPQRPVTPPVVQEPATVRRFNPRPEVEDLIREGNKRMREGDIVEARQFYQKAVALGDAAGDAEASLAMGRSYDPIYFARIDKKNAEPDAAKAFEWYRKARDAGAAQTAMVRIENLKHFLNE
jgi:hypothetical protein